MGYEDTYQLLLGYYHDCLEYWSEMNTPKKAHSMTLLDVRDAHTNPYVLKYGEPLHPKAKQDFILWAKSRAYLPISKENPFALSTTQKCT